MTKAERETVIQWDWETKQVSLYSCLKSVWRKAERAGWALLHSQRDADGREISREYTAPLAQFRFSCQSAESRAKQAARMSEVATARGFGKR